MCGFLENTRGGMFLNLLTSLCFSRAPKLHGPRKAQKKAIFRENALFADESS